MLLGQAYDLLFADRKINVCTPKTLAFYHDSAGAFVRFAATTATDAAVTSVADSVTPFFLPTICLLDSLGSHFLDDLT